MLCTTVLPLLEVLNSCILSPLSCYDLCLFLLPFAPPLHVLFCNERFQQHAGSINSHIFSCKLGRRCLVALSAHTSKRSVNRYLFAVVKLLLCASPLQVLTCNGRFQRRAGSINRPIYSSTRERRCSVALCATNKQKNGKQVICFRM